jgi:NhaP-type Na+/H+ or K+/H+ antiporter
VTFLLAYSILLVLAGLLSAVAKRTILSTAVLFLVGGALCGEHFLDIVPLEPGSDLVHWGTEVALYVVLYTDAMRVSLTDLKQGWGVPLRLLAVAMPLTMVVIAVAAHLVLGFGWAEAALVAAVLGPTDPVLAEAIIGHEGLPAKMRRALNIESGMNDGLALPVVIVVLASLSGSDAPLADALVEIAIGVAIGVAVPLVAVGLERIPALGTAERYDRVMPAAVGLLVFSLCSQLGANLFLAAFAAGVTLATIDPRRAEQFEVLGGTATELLKLAALFLVGGLLPDAFYTSWSFAIVAFVVLALFVARPAAVALSLVGTPAPPDERAVIAWFGPKGFASVTFTLLVLRAGIPEGPEVAFAAGAVIVVSIVLHASTDVLVAKWLLHRRRPEGDTDPAVGDGDRSDSGIASGAAGYTAEATTRSDRVTDPGGSS